MEKEDVSYQTLEQLHERRKQVVRLHKQGIKVMQIVKMVELSYPTIRSVIDLFVDGGWPAPRPTLRGHESGQGVNSRKSSPILRINFYVIVRKIAGQYFLSRLASPQLDLNSDFILAHHHLSGGFGVIACCATVADDTDIA
jgi:Winged helix-turn helix